MGLSVAVALSGISSELGVNAVESFQPDRESVVTIGLAAGVVSGSSRLTPAKLVGTWLNTLRELSGVIGSMRRMSTSHQSENRQVAFNRPDKSHCKINTTTMSTEA